MMILYSGSICPFSHSSRFMLFEKAMDFEVRDIDLFNKPDDITIMNPYGTVPILVERELVIYESAVINEFIDERWPHPQLMPYDPTLRAKIRLMLKHFEREFFVHMQVLENKSTERLKQRARTAIQERLVTMIPMFEECKNYLFGEELTMADISLAPLLWRLNRYEIKVSKLATAMLKYSERVFSRKSFVQSLTPAEKVMYTP